MIPTLVASTRDSPSRTPRAHLYRASLEGTAYGVRHNLETMSAMGAPPRRLVAVGGGAKNPLWLQIVSDVSGLPQGRTRADDRRVVR
jgi:sugar (pentulose or hexulose) kinase